MSRNAAIPFVDLKANSASMHDDVLAAFENVIDSAGYILGKEVTLFEEEFADYCGAHHCVGVANGTEALHLSLRALDIGAGDEVITAGNSFAASALAISYTGATPVLADIDPHDYTLDPACVEAAITSRTRAIVPVHLYGQPAQMYAIGEIARRHGLPIVEDACQAHGARYQGKRAGALGDIGCFSFYPGKNLGAFGDGGAIVTNDAETADRLRALRNYGQPVKHEYAEMGFNCRLDTLQAAVLLVKLSHLDEWNQHRRRIANRYREMLADHPLVKLPVERDEVEHVYHLFVVRHPKRDGLIESLAAKNIHCGIHYPEPLDTALPFLKARTVPDGLPVCSKLAGEIVSLPMYPEMTDAMVGEVAEAIHSFSSEPALAPIGGLK
jgi:dTDP-4-amino-4,6-dideoxygalactose transaminase